MIHDDMPQGEWEIEVRAERDADQALWDNMPDDEDGEEDA